METRSDRKPLPSLLCPFMERECPNGDDTALFCRRALNSDEDDPEFANLWFTCDVALRMFSQGAKRREQSA